MKCNLCEGGLVKLSWCTQCGSLHNASCEHIQRLVPFDAQEKYCYELSHARGTSHERDRLTYG